MKFSIWLEQKKDYIDDSILKIFSGGVSFGDQEKEHLLLRNTNEFSNRILNKVIDLGILKNKFKSHPNKYIDIKNMVKNGIMIKDLLDKINDEKFAPNAKIKS
jgi:hypothetical protein